jgi:N-acetylmuramoyl-L-alanine amidase
MKPTNRNGIPPSPAGEGSQTLLPLGEEKLCPGSPVEKAGRKSLPIRARPAVAPKAAPPRRFGIWGLLCHGLRMEFVTPTVGLVTLAGCLTFLIAPEDGVSRRSSAGLQDPALPTIVVDAGHGGRDAGARANGLVEKDLTLDVALRIEKLLAARGFPTVMTRRDDSYLSLPERAGIANEIDRSVFVSIHFNKSTNTEASGIETFFATEKLVPEPEWTFAGFFAKRHADDMPDRGENLAAYVQNALLNRTAASDRGIKSRAFYVVRNTRSPAILVEGGFLSNPFEAQLISNPAYRDRLAAAIVEGVIEYAETLPKPPPPTPKLARTSP